MAGWLGIAVSAPVQGEPAIALANPKSLAVPVPRWLDHLWLWLWPLVSNHHLKVEVVVARADCCEGRHNHSLFNPSDEISIPDPAKVVMLWKQLSAWDCWKSGMQYAGTSGGNDRSKKWDVVTNLLLLKPSPNPTTNLSLNSCEFASKLTRAGIAP